MGSLPFKVGSSSSVFGHSGSPAVGSPLPFFGGLPVFYAKESPEFLTQFAFGFGYGTGAFPLIVWSSSSASGHSGKPPVGSPASPGIS